MAILVIAEHDNNSIATATLNTVAAAAQIGGDIHVLVAGQGIGALAEINCRKTSRHWWSAR